MCKPCVAVGLIKNIFAFNISYSWIKILNAKSLKFSVECILYIQRSNRGGGIKPTLDDK